MKKQYQVTLFCSSGAYRPVSCIVTREQNEDIDLSSNKEIRKEIQKAGITKICQKRLWGIKELTKFSYTKCKIRVYEK